MPSSEQIVEVAHPPPKPSPTACAIRFQDHLAYFKNEPQLLSDLPFPGRVFVDKRTGRRGLISKAEILTYGLVDETTKKLQFPRSERWWVWYEANTGWLERQKTDVYNNDELKIHLTLQKEVHLVLAMSFEMLLPVLELYDSRTHRRITHIPRGRAVKVPGSGFTKERLVDGILLHDDRPATTPLIVDLPVETPEMFRARNLREAAEPPQANQAVPLAKRAKKGATALQKANNKGKKRAATSSGVEDLQATASTQDALPSSSVPAPSKRAPANQLVDRNAAAIPAAKSMGSPQTAAGCRVMSPRQNGSPQVVLVQKKPAALVQKKAGPLAQKQATPLVQKKATPIMQKAAKPLVQKKVLPLVQKNATPLVQKKVSPLVNNKAIAVKASAVPGAQKAHTFVEDTEFAAKAHVNAKAAFISTNVGSFEVPAQHVRNVHDMAVGDERYYAAVEGEYLLQAIVAHRRVKKGSSSSVKQMQYLVKWKDYELNTNDWTTYSDLQSTMLLDDYAALHNLSA